MYPTNPNEWALYDQAMIDEGLSFVLTTAVDKYGDPLYVYYISNGIKFLCDLETYKPYRTQFSDGTYHEVQQS